MHPFKSSLCRRLMFSGLALSGLTLSLAGCNTAPKTEEAREELTNDTAKTLARMRQGEHGLIFTNLVDFDAKFGHRRDPAGYSAALAAFDAALPELLAAVPPQGALLLVSDHGNDPTWPGTDHTREYGLLLGWRPGLEEAVDLGERATFADLGATAADALGASWDGPGESFWPRLT